MKHLKFSYFQRRKIRIQKENFTIFLTTSQFCPFIIRIKICKMDYLNRFFILMKIEHYLRQHRHVQLWSTVHWYLGILEFQGKKSQPSWESVVPLFNLKILRGFQARGTKFGLTYLLIPIYKLPGQRLRDKAEERQGEHFGCW